MNTTTAIIPGKFTGAFCRWQGTAFASLVHAGISNHVAHKVCMDLSSDIGRVLAQDQKGTYSMKVSKADKDGARKIGLLGKAAVTSSHAMSLIFVCQTMDSLFTESLLASRRLPELSDTLSDYSQECEKWANEQHWSDAKASQQAVEEITQELK
jgi:hypothetical protein